MQTVQEKKSQDLNWDWDWEALRGQKAKSRRLCWTNERFSKYRAVAEWQSVIFENSYTFRVVEASSRGGNA